MFEAQAPVDLAEDKKSQPRPSFPPRSISDPTITENVADGGLLYGRTNYDSVGANMGSTNWSSSRLNRRPGDKKSEEDGDHESLDNAYADLFDEADNNSTTKSSMLSLALNDTLNMKSPIDLIQSDFPSTPSALFSNRTFPLELQTDETKPTLSTASPNSPPKLDSGGVEASLDAAALDTAANAFQQLYVSSDKNSPPALTPVSTSTTLRPAQTFYPAASDAGTAATTDGQGLPNLKPAISTNTATAAVNGNFSALLGNNPSAIVNNGLNPLTPPVVSSMTSTGLANPLGSAPNTNASSNTASNSGTTTAQGSTANAAGAPVNPANPMLGAAMLPVPQMMPSGQMPPGAIQQNGQFFMPQPMYLDQNGQPMYFRHGANQNGQYPPEFMYQAPDGTQMGMAMGATDPNLQNSHIGIIPYGNQMGQQNGMTQNHTHMVQGGYAMQFGVDPNGNPVQMNGQMMMANGQGATNGPAHQAGGQRMVFNPATGQYVSQAVTGMPGQRGPNGQMMQNNQMMHHGQQMMTNGMTPQPGNGQMGPPALVPRMNMGDGADPNGSGMMMPNGLPAMNGMQNGQGQGMYSMMNPNNRDNNMNNMINMNNMNNNMSMNRNNNFSTNGLSNNDYDNRGGNDARNKDNFRNDRDRDRDSRGNDRNRGNDRGNDRDRDRDRESGRGGRDSGRNNSSNSSNSSVAGANPVRDSLVEEFRSTYGKSRQWGLRDLLGHVTAFCQDQHGSRFIQQRLEVCADVDKQLIFDEILPAAQSLMTDVFGNYVLQKLFEYGSPDQCEALALLLKGQSVQLAMQMYGCRVVQKALEYVSTNRLIDLVTEFENPPLLLRCVHDSNGNHVIQKCIEIVSKVAKEAPNTEMADFLSGRIQFIITTFQGRVKELSSHPYGCRVVQRILEHCTNNQKAAVLEELRQCCTDLVQDCYGNYVIQFVMQHGWEADRAILIREVQSNLLDFSQHKFASNVVEKCLQYANKKDRDEMIWTIINVTFDLKSPVDSKGHCVLESMVRDPYANYVVQKVIDVSDERQRAAIMRYVKENITQLRRYTYGKHIIVRLEKITNEKF